MCQKTPANAGAFWFQKLHGKENSPPKELKRNRASTREKLTNKFLDQIEPIQRTIFGGLSP